MSHEWNSNALLRILTCPISVCWSVYPFLNLSFWFIRILSFYEKNIFVFLFSIFESHVSYLYTTVHSCSPSLFITKLSRTSTRKSQYLNATQKSNQCTCSKIYIVTKSSNCIIFWLRHRQMTWCLDIINSRLM